VDLEAKDSEKVLLYYVLNSRYQTGLRSPLDDAILKHEEVNIDRYQRVDEIPFDFIRKRLSVVVSEEKETILITKGAPEEINRVISHYELDGKMYDLTSEARSKIDRQYRDLSSQGFRVLGVSYRKVSEGKTTYSVIDETDMVFLGDLNIRECDGCHVCWTGKPCCKQDDMNALYEKIIASDVIVFGTPVYWFGPTAIMKAFIDRFVYFNCPENRVKIKGKAAAIIIPFEDDDLDTARPLVELFEKI
jgi:hypothetical protein